MNKPSLVICQCALLMLAFLRPTMGSASTQPQDMYLANGWLVTQDVRELGEKIGWYEPRLVTSEIQHLFDAVGHKPDLTIDWQPIDRLVHLQLLLAPQPYFGRSLRYFNDSPWWYRLEFTSPGARHAATLRFEGVDYFAKVWLNGVLLGEHEGYADPFEFEVGALLKTEGPNVLTVKVSSPWDRRYANPSFLPEYAVVRNLIKGSYEHADGFVQRDVNPIGIWRPVKLIFHDDLHENGTPNVTTVLSSDQKEATVKVAWPIVNDGATRSASYQVRIRLAGAQTDLAASTQRRRIEHGQNLLETQLPLPSPKLWTTWDRGGQPLYEARLEVVPGGGAHLRSSVTFGVRTVGLHRSAKETRFFLNGQPIYLRGTTYWPDLYLSNMSRDRYERDIRAALRAGINAFRVHVHTENPEFYELCDRLGIVVIQDNDLNWVFPTDTAFEDRAVQHFGALIRLLENHPSVIAWIAMNEVSWGQGVVDKILPNYRESDAKAIGARLVSEAARWDPSRPVIENSTLSNDLASGDTHDYRGSLTGGSSTYFDISTNPQDWLGSPPKLVTEFGVDAPPGTASLQAVPEAAARLSDVLPHVAELQDYQYRLLKYYIECYRIHKYAPNAGYFQFMWIDFSPQSFYGIYDYWGNPKAEGLGGGLRAMMESNQPIGIFMEHDTAPHALYAVNDTSDDLGTLIAHWRVTDGEGVVNEGSQPIRLGPDGHERIRDLTFPVKPGETYQILLELRSTAGGLLASNTYTNPFQAQPRPKGYPERMDDELGMRLWWAGEKP